MVRPLQALLPLVLVLALPACGDDPVAHSETVSIELSGIKPGDLKNGVASEEKNINTESGNPYAEFLKNARAALRTLARSSSSARTCGSTRRRRTSSPSRTRWSTPSSS